MFSIDVLRSVEVSRSARARQLGGMFDVPVEEKVEHRWKGEIDLDPAGDWNVGVIVGPSGCGKSTIAREMFGSSVDSPLSWKAKSVIDDFSTDYNMQDITAACSAVGFNTIPSWLKPFQVLSNGEKFRVELARRLLEQPDPIVVDEFTSVVDRQVAKIGAYACAKFARRQNKHFVAVTCHYDVLDWMDPDWVLEPAQMRFERRRLRRIPKGTRPKFDLVVSPVDYGAWTTFAPFHYMSNKLHRAAKCFCMFVGGEAVAFAGHLPRPVKSGECIYGLSRLVTLPDWQGVGLAPFLTDTIASAFKTFGQTYHSYPAHPALVRGFDKSPLWQLRRKPGRFSRAIGKTSSLGDKSKFGGRPCAVFRYVGPEMDRADARQLLGAHYKWAR